MYYVTPLKGLIWQTCPAQPRTEKSGWDEMGLQLRWDCLLKRTQLLCEPDPQYFGKPVAPRSAEAQHTTWNVIAELMLLDVIEKGYMTFVSPSNSNGFKLELIGWLDTLKILVVEDGGIIWDLYREQTDEQVEGSYEPGNHRGHYGPDGEEYGGDGMLKLSDTAGLIASGYFYPEADGTQLLAEGRKLRHQLAELLEGCRKEG